MGLYKNDAKFLLYAKALGVDFVRTATMGRQNLYVSPVDLRDLLEALRYPVDDSTLESVAFGSGGYAEALLRFLGADLVHSFDYADYEGATHIHDMNEPVPDSYKGQYSVVFDGGTLEHVFNFPVAMKSCMEMVRPGGHYLAITPTNNYMGHGFYQFSPELYFGLFTATNGYQLVRVVFSESEPDAEWFAVENPSAAKRRVSLVNRKPACLLVIAKRVQARPVLASPPQQVDYARAWNKMRTESTAASSRSRGAVYSFLRRHVPTGIRKRIRKLSAALEPEFDPALFKSLDVLKEIRSIGESPQEEGDSDAVDARR